MTPANAPANPKPVLPTPSKPRPEPRYQPLPTPRQPLSWNPPYPLGPAAHRSAPLTLRSRVRSPEQHRISRPVLMSSSCAKTTKSPHHYAKTAKHRPSLNPPSASSAAKPETCRLLHRPEHDRALKRRCLSVPVHEQSTLGKHRVSCKVMRRYVELALYNGPQ